MPPSVPPVFPPSLGLTQQVSPPTTSGSEVVSYISDLGPEKPVLTLVHGYPQSAFEWRYVIPLLKDKVSLFVPELPGYGNSTPCKPDHSKRVVGAALLEALASAFNVSSSSRRKVILGGHDRGARICHRLAVDKDRYTSSGLDVIGTILMDISPTKVQWEAFADPKISSGYFHWPLLANVEVGMAMIKAYGGAKWCRDAHFRIKGSNEASMGRIAADGAVEVYAELFDRDDVLRYSGEDYAAGAGVDVKEQKEDQAAGRKIEVPALIMFSATKLGGRPDVMDVEAVWREWVKPGVPYKGLGLGNGVGHYLPEEAYEEVTENVVAFLKQYS